MTSFEIVLILLQCPLPAACTPLFAQWDAENIYLILEWCSGGDLSCFIRSRKILPERVARRFLQQMGKPLFLFTDAHKCILIIM